MLWDAHYLNHSLVRLPACNDGEGGYHFGCLLCYGLDNRQYVAEGGVGDLCLLNHCYIFVLILPDRLLFFTSVLVSITLQFLSHIRLMFHNIDGESLEEFRYGGLAVQDNCLGEELREYECVQHHHVTDLLWSSKVSGGGMK